MEQIEALNRALFLKINAGLGTSSWLINSVIFIAEDLIYLIPMLLLVLWFWGDKDKRRLALKVCMVVMLALGINQGIGLLWPHPRPFMVGLGQNWLAHAATSSFPSNHMTVFASVGLSLLSSVEIGLAVVILVSGLCVAWSRVYLGVHFPLDMLGAVGVSAFAYLMIMLVWGKIGNTITYCAECLYRLVMAQPIARGWMRR